MSKLTEIKERLDGIKQRGTGLVAYSAREYFHEFAEEDITYLLSLLEEKDKALEWANRIIGSGLDTGTEMRYDPRQWLIDYHTSSNNEGDN
ncbi:MAG TPA: hypothetical protein DEA91_00160 [Paenibacillus sp.]|nr:hypothetical protein [Paenibacillus sp.]